MSESQLKAKIRDIPDFPKEGIIFKDISPLLQDKDALANAITLIAKPFVNKKVDYIVGIEARGFIFGAAVAKELGAGFVPVRKKGKLPHTTERVTYDLEYGTDTLEIHADAIQPGTRVVIVDDLLATGGTVQAVSSLLARQKADIIGISFLIELSFLNGRQKLGQFPLHSVITY